MHTDYQYTCLQCSRKYPGIEAELLRLHCDVCGESALLEAKYAKVSPSSDWPFDMEDPSFFRYRNWLPVHRTFSQAALPTVHKSKAFVAKFGLRDLDLLFSGYSEQSDIRSGTFKEFEAYAVFGYIDAMCSQKRVLVVASAGNTARAFAEVALRENLEVILVVPDIALESIKLSLPIKEDSKVAFVVSTHKSGNEPNSSNIPSEYAEAIAIAKILCQSPHFVPEGGVKNIARRDGLGVGYLHAQWIRFQQKPDSIPYRYYFQAIGSGTGAIGSYSMYRRLQTIGRIPKEHQLSLMLAQNSPFIPVVEHWQARSKNFRPYESEDSLQRNSKIFASVLANRNPPYAITGGLADLLQESNGCVFAVENHEITEMQDFFACEEGLELEPAAAVAAAALGQAANHEQLDKSQPVLLHLTGGGQSQWQRDFPQSYGIEKAYTVNWTELENSPEKQSELICKLEKRFGFQK